MIPEKTHRAALPLIYFLFVLLLAAVMLLSVCAGSVTVPVSDTLRAVWNTVWGIPLPEGTSQSIIVFVRLPRVLCVALVGASLSLCGAAMQGLLRNPLADGSTLGVSSGASVGAVLAIAFGITIPGIPFGGTVILAMLFAFLTMMLLLALSYRLDFSLSTNTIILMGVIFSMFANSIISLIITFAGSRLKSIVFWTMGSLAGSSYPNAGVLFAVLVVFGAVILRYSRELNAFAIGEDHARHIGVEVRRVKFLILISVSAIIGVCVAIGGTIGFVGLVIPHITRFITGPNHKRLLPVSMFTGAVFLVLADLAARVMMSPIELPIGVVTSFIGSVFFILIFMKYKKGA